MVHSATAYLKNNENADRFGVECKKTTNRIHEEEPWPHWNYTTGREFVNTASLTFPEKNQDPAIQYKTKRRTLKNALLFGLIQKIESIWTFHSERSSLHT